MLTLSDFAAKHNISRTRVHQLLKQGRIKGAKLLGARSKKRGMWVIPATAGISPPSI